MTDPLTELRRADALHRDQHYASAVESYRTVLAGDPLLLEAWYGLGCAHRSLQAYGAAAEALRRAVELRPGAYGARCSLAEVLFQLGEVGAAMAEFRSLIAIDDPEIRALALANIACIAPGSMNCDNADILAARRSWADSVGAMPRVGRPVTQRNKLRIGYLSGFFGARNWMKFVWGVVNGHDRGEFEVYLLSDGDDPSAESGYVDHDEDRVWRIRGAPNAALARRIAEAELDVLVDLNGYSVLSRFPLLRYRAAPLQICWMNMYGPTGLPEIDYVVGDDAVIPPEEEQFHCERVVRVSGSYLAFAILYPVPEVAPPPCVETGRFTYGCLASPYKLDDMSVASYARILHGAPGSRLLLRNKLLGEASNRAWLLGRFGRYGISAERLLLEGGAEHFEFLRTYDRVDVVLDTFPYSGGTTTAEALWQGVPTLTFNGDRWASRTSRSLLLAAGLGEFVADHQAGFESAAIALATRPDTPVRLSALRAGMRDRLRNSAACDVETLRLSLEALYRGDNGDGQSSTASQITVAPPATRSEIIGS
jgi:protein O-GlcNAc transferase